MKRLFLSLVLSLAFVPAVFAGNFSIDLNQHSTQVEYVQQLDTQNYGDTFAKVRYLYNDDSSTNLFGAAAGVTGTPGNAAGLKLGLDVAVNGGQTKNDQKLLAVGLGFMAEYTPPALQGVGFAGHLVYSPEIFTFMDGKDYLDWGCGVSYKVLPNAKVTLAYQNIQADIKNRGNRDLDNTVRFGISLDF